jgi:hypothetical protein
MEVNTLIQQNLQNHIRLTAALAVPAAALGTGRRCGAHVVMN